MKRTLILHYLDIVGLQTASKNFLLSSSLSEPTIWHKLKNNVYYLIHVLPLYDNDNDVSFQKCIDSAIVKFLNKLHKELTTSRYYLRQLSSTKISQVRSSMFCLYQNELTSQSIQCHVKDVQCQRKQLTIHHETGIRYWQRPCQRRWTVKLSVALWVQWRVTRNTACIYNISAIQSKPKSWLYHGTDKTKCFRSVSYTHLTLPTKRIV